MKQWRCDLCKIAIVVPDDQVVRCPHSDTAVPLAPDSELPVARLCRHLNALISVGMECNCATVHVCKLKNKLCTNGNVIDEWVWTQPAPQAMRDLVSVDSITADGKIHLTPVNLIQCRRCEDRDDWV